MSGWNINKKANLQSRRIKSEGAFNVKRDVADILSTPAVVKAVVPDFDDVIVSESYLRLTSDNSSYAGFEWNEDNYWEVRTYDYYNGSYFNNTLPAVSSPNFLMGKNWTASIVKSDGFKFIGAYLTGHLKDDSPQSYTAETVTIDGYYGGVLQGSHTADLVNGTMIYFETGWDFCVDKLTFTPGKGSSSPAGWFLMDDFTYENTCVPIPGAVWLLGSGLLSLIGIRRRRLNR